MISPTVLARCQAIAVRSPEVPVTSSGSVMCRVKNVRTPALRAASSTVVTRVITSAASSIWLRTPTCMS